LETQAQSEPPHVGCYHLNGLLSLHQNCFIGLEIFLHALLAEKTRRVRHNILAAAEKLAGDLEIILRLFHPLTRASVVSLTLLYND
jgi:hypothetical protein